MRHRVGQAATLILFGAVINFVVAVALIWSTPVPVGVGRLWGFEGTWYGRRDSIGITYLYWTADPVSTGRFEPGNLPHWSRLRRMPRSHATANVSELRQIEGTHEYAVGWPVRAYLFEHDVGGSASSGVRSAIRQGIPLPSRSVLTPWGWLPQPRAIPLNVIGRGLAVNLLVYALSLAVLWRSLAAMRRGCRRWHCACENCGYSRAGLTPGAPCPECGQRARSVRTYPKASPQADGSAC
jgi:hypothetical protein